jgi:hypothetical protein
MRETPVGGGKGRQEHARDIAIALEADRSAVVREVRKHLA